MFELLLGTEFFYRADLSQAQIITLLAELPSTNNRDILRRRYFFFLLKSDRHKKGKIQTNKQKKKTPKKTEYNNKANNKVSRSNIGVCRSQLLVCFALKF